MSQAPQLKDFTAQMTKGLARTNRFFVKMPGDDNDQMIGMFCENVQLPGSTMLTTPSKIFGEAREIAYERQYEPINMSFYVDSQFRVKEFFDKWHDSIFDPYTRAGNYYTKYVRPMEIWVHNTEDKRTYAIALEECYPKSIGAIQMDYGSKEIMKLQVTMQFKYWRAIAGEAAASESALANITNPPVVAGGDTFEALDTVNLFGSYFQSSGFGIPQDFLSDFNGFQGQLNAIQNFNVNDAISGAKSSAKQQAKDQVNSYLGGLFG